MLCEDNSVSFGHTNINCYLSSHTMGKDSLYLPREGNKSINRPKCVSPIHLGRPYKEIITIPQFCVWKLELMKLKLSYIIFKKCWLSFDYFTNTLSKKHQLLSYNCNLCSLSDNAPGNENILLGHTQPLNQTLWRR